MPDTRTMPKPRDLPGLQPERPAIDPDRGWKVVLHNDEYHDFDQVVYAVQRAAALSLEVAEMITLEAHENGSAVVKRGIDEAEAHVICGGLRKWTRGENLPGVDCQALPDDTPDATGPVPDTL